MDSFLKTKGMARVSKNGQTGANIKDTGTPTKYPERVK
jgi:hypothetical protein